MASTSSADRLPRAGWTLGHLIAALAIALGVELLEFSFFFGGADAVSPWAELLKALGVLAISGALTGFLYPRLWVLFAFLLASGPILVGAMGLIMGTDAALATVTLPPVASLLACYAGTAARRRLLSTDEPT